MPAKPWSGRGRPTSRTRRDPEHQPVQAKALALGLPEEAWQTITWREGSADWLTSRFARVRVRAAHRDERLNEAPRRGMAADRMAAGREGADQILVRQPARRHLLRAAGRSRQAALADRARLPGTQAGTRPWTLRGTRLARLPPSRHTVHRCLRVPDLRAGDDSPLRTVPPRCSRNLPFPTVTDPEAPPIRPERHIPNSIATMRRRLTVALARSLDRCPCCNAPRRPQIIKRRL